MSINLKLVLAVLILSSAGIAQVGAKSASSSPISDTQNRRSTERFSVIDMIRSNQNAVNAQNAKYGRGGGGAGPYVDIGLSYSQDSGAASKDGVELGKDSRSSGGIQFYLDDLITRGNRSKLLNIDLGVEGFLSQTTSFAADSGVAQTSHSYKELGGGLLVRPFGRSSQDTGLAFKGGYVSVDETGLWANNQTPASLYGVYLGADAKIYLLNFLGIFADYQNVLETPVTVLNGKWKMQRFKYGAFVEVYLVNLSAYFISNEMVLTNNVTSVPVKETYSGVGFAGTLFF